MRGSVNAARAVTDPRAPAHSAAFCAPCLYSRATIVNSAALHTSAMTETIRLRRRRRRPSIAAPPRLYAETLRAARAEGRVLLRAYIFLLTA
jgi:hypothetical protein